MGESVADLTALERTALLTVYARALDCRWARPILADTAAAAAVRGIDFDFATFAVPASVVGQTALRAKMLDDRVAAFVAAHPDAVVVELGAGLSSAAARVGVPAGVDWYAVDLPAVTALHTRLAPAAAGVHALAADLTDPDWLAGIPAGRPTLLFADGLFAFMAVPAITALLAGIVEHFGAGQLLFNDYGRVAKTTEWAMRHAPRGMFKVIGELWANPGFADPHTPVGWQPRLRLVEEASLAHAPEVARYPLRLRLPIRLFGRTRVGARKARILRYTF